MEIPKLKGDIWKNGFVTKLAILDHCNELIIIDKRVKELKNSLTPPAQYLSEKGNLSNTIEQQNLIENFESELADLLLILSNHFTHKINGDSLISQRLGVFESNIGEEI